MIDYTPDGIPKPNVLAELLLASLMPCGKREHTGGVYLLRKIASVPLPRCGEASQQQKFAILELGNGLRASKVIRRGSE